MAEPRIVAALAYPGVQLLDIVGPLEAFNLASQQRIDDGETPGASYRVTTIARRRGPVASMSGLALVADRDLRDGLDGIDTLLIPGALTGGTAFYDDPEYVEWLRQAAGRVRRLCSVCSGALLLASAGLLDGRRATTHWMDAKQLRDCFPGVRVESDRIFIEDGGIYTSGGITAGIDLALALIERDFSRRLALKTAKRLLVFLKRPGDQSQFSSFLASQTEPGRFEAMLDWITENLDADLATPTLAKRACMSERSFRRRFEADLGMPVQQYIARARLNKARRLLESTASPLAAIAADCGYGSRDALRYAFTTQLNVTPSDYRRRFGGPSGGV